MGPNYKFPPGGRVRDGSGDSDDGDAMALSGDE